MEIVTKIITKEGQRLDMVVYETYGSLRHLEEVLEHNIKVIGSCVHLHVGCVLELPLYPEEDKHTEIEASQLW